MRIQHNISAMNSYRQLGNNNNMLGKNLEKLSSGYRINRAGDDAAGLAISEKMRAQIKGLETAQKNANDGISLVQTAEGALTEVHSMLNRMTELATQSANGTYDNEVDRANLQKEVVALKEEINRISDSTNFNGINLLDGTLGMNTEAFSVGARKAAEGVSVNASTLTVNATKTAKEGITAGQAASFQIDLNGIKANKANGEITVDVGGAQVTIKVTNAGDDISTGSLQGTVNALQPVSAKQGDGTTDVTFTAAFNNGILTFTQNNTPIKGEAAFDISTLNATVGGDATTPNQYNPNVQVTTPQIIPTDVQKAEANFEIDFNNMKDGTKLTIGDQTLVFKFDVGSNVTAGTGEKLVDLSALKHGIDMKDNTWTAAEKTTVAEAVARETAANGVWVVGVDGGTPGKITLVEKQSHAVLASNAKIQDLTTGEKIQASIKQSTSVAAKHATTDINVDTSKLIVGDKLTVNGKVYEFVAQGGTASDSNNIAVEVAGLTGKAGDATGDAAKALADAIAANDTAGVQSATSSGKVVTVTAKNVTDDPINAGSAGVKLQVGDTAEEFNKVNVKIDATDTQTLGIADIDISTQEGAAAAVDKIKKAINQVSSTRGDLGAVQNRLEHTINNLGVTTENITAAESRIRDTDMAAEMMAYTKNNILIQASQAMLAQANQVPQGVLQLLQ